MAFRGGVGCVIVLLTALAAPAQGLPRPTPADARLPRPADPLSLPAPTARQPRSAPGGGAARADRRIRSRPPLPSRLRPAPGARGLPAARPVVDQPELRVRLAAVAARAGQHPAPRAGARRRHDSRSRAAHCRAVREYLPGGLRAGGRVVVQRPEHARRGGQFLHDERRLLRRSTPAPRPCSSSSRTARAPRRR